MNKLWAMSPPSRYGRVPRRCVAGVCEGLEAGRIMAAICHGPAGLVLAKTHGGNPASRAAGTLARDARHMSSSASAAVVFLTALLTTAMCTVELCDGSSEQVPAKYLVKGPVKAPHHPQPPS